MHGLYITIKMSIELMNGYNMINNLDRVGLVFLYRPFIVDEAKYSLVHTIATIYYCLILHLNRAIPVHPLNQSRINGLFMS